MAAIFGGGSSGGAPLAHFPGAGGLGYGGASLGAGNSELKCDDDVARVSGRMLAIATYRATQFACQGKCVEPQSVGCKGK